MLKYLASPYSDPDPAVCEARFRAACRAAAILMQRGESVYSPIAHSHPIAEHVGNHLDHDFWLRQDREMLRRCDAMIVLMLPGWENSRGIAAEIELADELDLEVLYMDPSVVFGCETCSPAGEKE